MPVVPARTLFRTYRNRYRRRCEPSAESGRAYRYACCAPARGDGLINFRAFAITNIAAQPLKVETVFTVHQHRQPIRASSIDSIHDPAHRSGTLWRTECPHTFRKEYPAQQNMACPPTGLRPASPVLRCRKGKPEHTDRNAHRHWQRRSRLWLGRAQPHARCACGLLL